MKFARRQAAPPEEPATPAPPAVPQAPRGAPVAVLAGVLDGQRLWVAVDARPGTLALRAADGGRAVVPLADEVPDDQPAYLGARLDLGGLPGTDEAVFDVVVVPPGGRDPVAVWSHPLDRTSPTGGTPRAADGRTTYTLQRTDDGHLQVRRARVRAGAELARTTVAPDGLHLVLRGTGTVAVLGEGDAVLATYPTAPHGDDGHVDVVVATGPLGEAPAQVARVVLGEPGAWLPVRRRANDLAEAGRAAPLPQLYAGPDDGEPRLRLRWSNAGVLQARLFDPGAAPDAGPDVGPDTTGVDA